MQVPVQITFKGIDQSDAIEARVREEIDRLEQFHERITSARVVIARPQHRRRQGDSYHIQIHLEIPGAADIAVSRDPGDDNAHEDVYVTIRDAFKAAQRQLQDVARKRRGDIKQHDVPPHGHVAVLNPERDHGFISTSDGRVIYFHRNSVANGGFDTLAVGQEVRFAEDVGDEGPRATFVQVVGKHHLE